MATNSAAPTLSPLSASGTPSIRQHLLPCLLLLAISSLWLVTVRLPFIKLDDPLFVYENTIVSGGLSFHAIAWSFTTHAADYWHPLTWISLCLDTTLFGAAPWGYHLTNALLHIINTLLVYALFRGMTRNTWRSVFAAILFSIHPQRVESVAWVTERKDVLAAFFGLLTILAYMHFLRRRNAARYLLMFLLYICSLLSKPMLVTLPALLLILDFWPLQRLRGKTVWQLIREKLPLFALAAAFCVNTWLYVAGGPAIRGSFANSLAACFVNYAAYLREFVAPGHLALFDHTDHAVPITTAILAAALLAAITLACLVAIRRRFSGAPALLAGWLWFLVCMLPTSGIVQAGYSMRGDRFTYFPTLGLIAMLVWGLAQLLPLRRMKLLTPLLACAVTVALAILTANRLALWHDPLALYEHDLKINPDNAYLHFLAGIESRDKGLAENARSHFHRAHELEPRDFNVPPEFAAGK
jgi:hypothetical protein